MVYSNLMKTFTPTVTDGLARAGSFETAHGTVQTPMFMPVGTHGAVKGVSPLELKALGSQTVLANTYHLALRPGEDVVKEVGGLHAFTGWQGPMLTDSGGFQAFSLGDRTITGRKKAAMRKVTEEGVTFRSHHDGTKHLITPERSIEIQQALGADVIMAFDQPVYGLSSPRDAEKAMERTHRWLDRSIAQWESNKGDQLLFGIVQGGTHTELHKKSAAYVVSKDLPGNALGGLSVGENKAEMWEATRSICSLLPEDKPRYFMGLGDPLDLIEAVLRGCDMFDCVAPSRLARHGVIWQITGTAEDAFWKADTEALLQGEVKIVRANYHASAFRHDSTIFKSHPGFPEDLKHFSNATIAHYTRSEEMLAYRILTLHNIGVLHRVCDHLRSAIALGKTTQLRECFS